jgi:hypothetical protein
MKQQLIHHHHHLNGRGSEFPLSFSQFLPAASTHLPQQQHSQVAIQRNTDGVVKPIAAAGQVRDRAGQPVPHGSINSSGSGTGRMNSRASSAQLQVF